MHEMHKSNHFKQSNKTLAKRKLQGRDRCTSKPTRGPLFKCKKDFHASRRNFPAAPTHTPIGDINHPSSAVK